MDWEEYKSMQRKISEYRGTHQNTDSLLRRRYISENDSQSRWGLMAPRWWSVEMDWMGGSVTLADSRQWQTEEKTNSGKYKNIKFILGNI